MPIEGGRLNAFRLTMIKRLFFWSIIVSTLVLSTGKVFAQNADSSIASSTVAKQATADSLTKPDEARPFATNQPSLTGHYLKLLAITIVLLLLFWVSMKYMRKIQFGNDRQKNTRILVISRQYLTSKHSIWLVVIGGQKYLLGVTDHAINLIDRLGPVSEDELNTAKQMPLPSFGNLLEKLRKGKG